MSPVNAESTKCTWKTGTLPQQHARRIRFIHYSMCWQKTASLLNHPDSKVRYCSLLSYSPSITKTQAVIIPDMSSSHIRQHMSISPGLLSDAAEPRLKRFSVTCRTTGWGQAGGPVGWVVLMRPGSVGFFSIKHSSTCTKLAYKRTQSHTFSLSSWNCQEGVKWWD